MAHSNKMTAGCSMHVLKPHKKGFPVHGHQAFNVWWTIPPAWLCQQRMDAIKCWRQMSREGSQQGKMALFHEDNSRPECTARMWSTLELSTSGAHGAMQWGYVIWPPRWENQTGGSIQDGLQPVLQLARDTNENRVAVVHLAENQSLNQGQQGMTWHDRDRHTLRIWCRAMKHALTTAVTWVLMVMSGLWDTISVCNVLQMCIIIYTALNMLIP